MPEELLLPIKVVFKQDGDDYTRRRAPQAVEPLTEVTPRMREDLGRQVENTKAQLSSMFIRWPGLPAVAKVKLHPKAIAKYRRPGQLFNRDTCPIVGGGSPQELYATATPRGLNELARRITSGRAGGELEANISCVSAIAPYTQADALGTCTVADVANFVKQHPDRPLKFRLFKHRDPATNAALHQALLTYFRQLNVGDIEILDYAPSLSMYALHGVRPEVIDDVSRFIGTQSLSTFPNYRIVRTASRAVANVTAANFPPPDPHREYGVVGVIDSGTDPSNTHLQAWVVDRHDHVPRSQQNNDHGSFVAGLIIHPRLLNHGDKRFPDVSSRIVDVVAIDKSGNIDEYDLRTIIEDSLTRYPSVKMWNMSLAMDGHPCRDDEFSEFAAFIDSQEQSRGVLFHLPAGNYADSPMRSWPPQAGLGDADRICPPADSVRSLVIGSRAHRDSNVSRVKAGEPSPFSRRGPAGAYLMKPELSAPGGNCDAHGNCPQIGVLSIDGSGHIAENIGTSFASPLVASLSASVHRELQVGGEEPSPVLVKALQLHSAFVSTGRLDRDLINYVGLGSPADADSIVSCTKSAATCIFQIPVATSPQFMRRPFPMPKCLEHAEKGLVGEVFMTLYYDPPLDRRFGAEYCRNNVTASLGTVRTAAGKEPGTFIEVHHREIEPVPKELDEGWEDELIKNGYKWSPLKLYHHRFRAGPTEWDWQLNIAVQNRAEFPSLDHQLVYLIITVRDPFGVQPVYTEMVQQMNKLGWITADLKVRQRHRLDA